MTTSLPLNLQRLSKLKVRRPRLERHGAIFASSIPSVSLRPFHNPFFFSIFSYRTSPSHPSSYRRWSWPLSRVLPGHLPKGPFWGGGIFLPIQYYPVSTFPFLLFTTTRKEWPAPAYQSKDHYRQDRPRTNAQCLEAVPPRGEARTQKITEKNAGIFVTIHCHTDHLEHLRKSNENSLGSVK